MRSRVAVVATVALLALPAAAWSQAWTPPAGSGSISVSFQSVNHLGHLLTDGSLKDEGRSRTAAAYADIEFGLTRRFAFAFSVPFVWARYVDDSGPPEGIPFLPVDSCRCWHSDWQDFGLTARFKLLDTFDHVIVVTPTVAVGAPSHNYAYQGEAVVGRSLNEIRAGVDASYRLDAISRNLAVNGRYQYAFVEEVIDVPTNRSSANGSAEYRISGDWSIGGFVAWQRTHGGLRVGAPGSGLEQPGEVNTPERGAEHDRLLRDNYTHIGAQASYHLTHPALFHLPDASLFTAVTWSVMGTDSHKVFAVTGGVSVPFSIGR